MAEAPAGALGELLTKLSELVSPEVIKALSPSEGLEVKSHTFNSIEQEGHWKGSAFGGDRRLEPPDSPAQSGPATHSAALRPGGSRAGRPAQPAAGTAAAAGWSRRFADRTEPTEATAAILHISVPDSKFQWLVAAPQLLDFIGVAFGKKSDAYIDARWIKDGLEIWGGDAGLGRAKGFESLYGHQARVELDGIQYGNYFPSQYLITFSGNVNPLGPVFVEFKGGVIIGADGLRYPWYFEYWMRDGKEAVKVQRESFNPDTGWVLDLARLPSRTP